MASLRIWNKPNDVIRGTVKHHTEPFEGGKRDVSIPTIQFFCWTRRPAHWTKQQPFDC